MQKIICQNFNSIFPILMGRFWPFVGLPLYLSVLGVQSDMWRSLMLNGKNILLDFFIIFFDFYSVSGCSPVYLDEEVLEECPDHHGYDYFKGSELSFIILWTCFGTIPFSKYSYIFLPTRPIFSVRNYMQSGCLSFQFALYRHLLLRSAEDGSMQTKSERCRRRQ
jgi:hypothetical protein